MAPDMWQSGDVMLRLGVGVLGVCFGLGFWVSGFGYWVLRCGFQDLGFGVLGLAGGCGERGGD